MHHGAAFWRNVTKRLAGKAAGTPFFGKKARSLILWYHTGRYYRILYPYYK
jgi:hypothetical protein